MSKAIKETTQLLKDELVMDKIYVVRGQKVMLDEDLAELYEVETKHLKRQVRRNIDRFPPEDFMFELSKDEFENLRGGLRRLAPEALLLWGIEEVVTDYLIDTK